MLIGLLCKEPAFFSPLQPVTYQLKLDEENCNPYIAWVYCYKNNLIWFTISAERICVLLLFMIVWAELNKLKHQ